MTDKSHFEGEDLRLAQIDESLTSSSKWKTFIDIQLPSALLNWYTSVILNQGQHSTNPLRHYPSTTTNSYYSPLGDR